MAQTGIPALELPQRRDGQQDLILNLDDGKCIGSDWLILWAVPRRGRNTTGPIAVSKVSNGRANIAEVGAGCASDPMERLSRRLLDPRTHQWSIWWANRADGILDRVPTVGTFENGRGEFSSFQPIEGRWVLVRFIFSAVTTNSMHGEQAHSTDGGKTWAPNWIEDLTREE